jgi:long-chain acyl-CoA synthetase
MSPGALPPDPAREARPDARATGTAHPATGALRWRLRPEETSVTIRDPQSPSPDEPGPTVRHEVRFGERVVRCFADRPPSVHAMFERSLHRFAERDAMVFEDRRWSWRALDEAAGRVAASLAARGLEPGERIVMLVSNRPEFVVTLLAALRLGAIAVPVSVREQAPGLAWILGQCAAAAIVHDDALADRLPLATDAPALRLRLATAEIAALADGETAPLRTAAPVREEDTAVILYTSGTTGRPKGATLSHVGIVHSAIHYEVNMRLGPDERSALAVPASHVTGLVALIATMWRVGGALVVVAEFKAPAFLALAARERITHTLMVPAMYALCLMQPDLERLDLSAWRIGAYGGAAMAASTIETLAARLPGLTPMNAYGSTETTSPATLMPIGEQPTHLESVGRPLQCVDIVVVDDDGREVPPGETGELLIGGPMVVRGYWENPEASAAGFVGGYWRSGDLGSKDADGYVRIHDRKKDMINRGGYKIWSVEVENVLVGHPGVIEAAAVGVPCPVLGERVHAFVFLDAASESGALGRDDPTALSTRLRAWCVERLADYKVPETVTAHPDPLPRNANGKLLKREMRDWVAPTSAPGRSA